MCLLNWKEQMKTTNRNSLKQTVRQCEKVCRQASISDGNISNSCGDFSRLILTIGFSQTVWVNCLRLTLFIVLIFLNAQNIIAGTPEIDFCQFKGVNNSYYLEFYIDFPRESITYKATPEGWYGALIFKVEVKREGMETAVDKWVIEDICENPEDIDEIQRMVDVRVYNLTPTKYSLEVLVKDSISGGHFSEITEIDIKRYPEIHVSVSDIEIASHHIIGELAPKFSRGEYSLVPNPRRIIGEEKPYFFYYFEVYPPSKIQSEDEQSDYTSQFTISRSVLNGIQDTVITLPIITRTAGYQGFAETDTVFIDGLESGSYRFVVSVTDSDKNVQSSEKVFFDFQREPIAEQFTSKIDSQAVEDELFEIGFMMNSGQRKFVNKLNLKEKAFFLEEFWKLYDDDTLTAEVPLRKTYRERVAEADKRWPTSRRKGHQTDRGRIHVLFGGCDNYDSFPLQADTKPYEIWTYERLEGGIEFVFVDRSGLGDYELVHSNWKGEINTPNWYEMYVQRSKVESRR